MSKKRLNYLEDQTMGPKTNLKFIIGLLILCLVPNLVIAQGKKAQQPLKSKPVTTVTITGTMEKSFELYQGMYTIKLKEYPDVEIKAPEEKLNFLAWLFAADKGKKVQITYQVKRDTPDSKPINIFVSGEILE